MKELIIGVVGVLAAFIIGGTMVKNDAITISPTIGNTGNTETAETVNPAAQSLGASAGPTHFNTEYFYGGVVQGGPIETISIVSTSTTITAKQVCDNGALSFASKTSSSSTTLPTAAALNSNCLMKDGDTKYVTFYNRGIAASTTAFAAGTGMTLYSPEVTGANGMIAGLNTVLLKFWRASSTAVFVDVSEQVPQ